MPDDAIERREDPEEGSEQRTRLFNVMSVSQLDYPQVLRRAVQHAVAARLGLAPPPVWQCIGPRNVGGRILSLAQDPKDPLIVYAGSAFGGMWRTRDGGDTWEPFTKPSLCVSVGTIAIPETRPDIIYFGTGSLVPYHVSGQGFHVARLNASGDPTFHQLALAPDGRQAPADAAIGAALRYTRIRVDPDDPLQFWVASQTGLWRCRLAAEPGIDPEGGPPAPAPALIWTRDFPPAGGLPKSAPPLFSKPLPAGNASWPAYATDLIVCKDPDDNDTAPTGRGRSGARYLVFLLALSGQQNPDDEDKFVGGVFRSTYDRKENKFSDWDKLDVPKDDVPRYTRIVLAQCERAPEHVYAVFARRDDRLPTPIYHNERLGRRKWDKGNPAPRPEIWDKNEGQAHFDLVLAASPNNPKVVYLGEIDLYKSEDFGKTLVPLLQWHNYDDGDYSQHADQHALVIDRGDRRKIWVGNDGGVSLAGDASRFPLSPRFWRKRSHGIIVCQFQDVTTHSDPDNAFISGGGLQDNGTFVSFGGGTWYRVGGGDGGGMFVASGDPRAFVVTTQSNIGTHEIAGPAVPNTINNPVLHDLPEAIAPEHSMKVTRPSYIVFMEGGPFVKAIEQSPFLSGQFIAGWSSRAVGNPLVAVRPPVNFLGAPVVSIHPSEECTAVAHGPFGGAPPVDAWAGTSAGQLFETAAAPGGPWHLVPFLTAGGIERKITGIATHPTDRNILAISSVAVLSSLHVLISTPGARGVSRFRHGSFQTVKTDACVPILGSAITLSFGAGQYDQGDSWAISVAGAVVPDGANTSIGVLAAATSVATPVVVTFVTAGGLKQAQLTVAVGGLPAGARLTAKDPLPIEGTHLILRFAGVGAAPAAFAIGDTWTITTPAVSVPGGGNSGGAILTYIQVNLPFAGFDVFALNSGPRGSAIVGYGTFGAPLATDPHVPIPGTALHLAFGAADYVRGDSFFVSDIGEVTGTGSNRTPDKPLTAFDATSSTIVVRISVAGAIGGASRFVFKIGDLPESPAALQTGPQVDLPGTLCTLQFTGGNLTAGDVWTISPVTGVATPNPANAGPGGLTAVVRTGGRVHLSHDRGGHWSEITYPASALPRPALPEADLSALPPCPVACVRFDLDHTNGLLTLFAGTLVGVYALQGANVMTIGGVPGVDIPPGQDVQLTAALDAGALPAIDVTDQVTWISSDTAVATVTATGLVHAVADGRFSIRVTRGCLPDAETADITVVTGAVALGPPAPVPPRVVDVRFLWRPFNNGLPLCLVSDIESIARPAAAPGPGILRIATFGRGIFDCNLAGAPRFRLYTRQNLIEDGQAYPEAGRLPFPLADDPRLPVGARDFTLREAFDIRVDSSPFKFFEDQVDGVEFDEEMPVDDVRLLAPNSVYVQVHNRGTRTIDDARVHLYFTWTTDLDVTLGADGIPNNLGDPNPVGFYTDANFEPPAGSWEKVGFMPVPPVHTAQPRVVRFDWVPPAPPPALAGVAPADLRLALLALCTSVLDDGVNVRIPGIATVHDLIDQDRRAALRIVGVVPVPGPDLYIRDGVDEVVALGEVVYGGRSPDIIAVQEAFADPAREFADLIDVRPQARLIRTAANEIYVRVHNRGPEPAEVRLRLFAVPIDETNTPVLAGLPGAWTDLTPVPPTLAVAARDAQHRPGIAYLNVQIPANTLNHPVAGTAYRAFALVALIESVAAGDARPALPAAAFASLDEFWEFFRQRVDAENAAIRALRLTET